MFVAKVSADERWGRKMTKKFPWLKKRVNENWAENFEGLLNAEEDREAEIIVVGRESGVNVLGEFNNSDHERGSPRGVKGDESRMGWPPVQCLKRGDTSVIQWLVIAKWLFCDQYCIS